MRAVLEGRQAVWAFVRSAGRPPRPPAILYGTCKRTAENGENGENENGVENGVSFRIENFRWEMSLWKKGVPFLRHQVEDLVTDLRGAISLRGWVGRVHAPPHSLQAVPPLPTKRSFPAQKRRCQSAAWQRGEIPSSTTDRAYCAFVGPCLHGSAA